MTKTNIKKTLADFQHLTFFPKTGNKLNLEQLTISTKCWKTHGKSN